MCKVRRSPSHSERRGAAKLVDGPFGDDLSLLDHPDSRAHQLDLAQEMARDQHRPLTLAELDDQIPDVGHALGVKTVGRLVEDQEVGLLEERRRNPQPLLHAHRVGRELVSGARRELDLLESRVHTSHRNTAVHGEEAEVVAAPRSRRP